MSWKRWLFLQPKSFSSPSCLAWAEKVRLFRKTKRFLLQKICLSTLKSDAFPQTKRFSFTQAILFCPQTPNVFTNQKLSIWTSPSVLFSKACLFCAKSVSIAQTFLNCYPKQPFSALRRPFAPSHNLLSTKERRCSFDVRSNSLRCNVRTSHRFKAFSPPFRAKSRFRFVPSESSAKIFFDRALNRGRRTESRVLFMLLFARRKK